MKAKTGRQLQALTVVTPAVAITMLLALVLRTTQAGQDKKPETAFVGKIGEEGPNVLLQPVEEQKKGLVFLCGIITGQKEFQAFSEAAELKKIPFELNWKEQAVVYVIHRADTQLLDFKQWKPPKDG